jgi:hypothetical protein
LLPRIVRCWRSASEVHCRGVVLPYLKKPEADVLQLVCCLTLKAPQLAELYNAVWDAAGLQELSSAQPMHMLLLVVCSS